MTYTGHTSFEHPTTGDEINVTVTFRAHPPEPDVGIFGNTYEVTDVIHDGPPMTSNDADVDAHVDGLTDDWFAEVIRDYHDGMGDYLMERQRDRQMAGDA